jgi:hypothetical protein
MIDQEDRVRRKKQGYMRWYPEKWLSGSTRDEMTHSERAIYADLLSKAYSNDPLGQVDFTSIRRLANELHASPKLLYSTIRKGVIYNKMRVIKVWQDPVSLKKYEEFELNIEQLRSNSETFSSKCTKSRVRLYAIIIIGWGSRQTAYLRQESYPKKADNRPTDASEIAPESEIDKPLGEERRREEIKMRGDDSELVVPAPISAIPSSPLQSSSSHSFLKEQFLLLLKECFGYPFDQEQDSALLDYAVEKFPEIDVLEQTEMKIKWWENKPIALTKSPRNQLKRWFRKEHEFRQGKRSPGRTGGCVDPYVGCPPPEPSDEENALLPQWNKEYKSYLDNYMKQNGIENEDDIDFTRLDVETRSAFISQKLKAFRASKIRRKG